VRHAWLTALLLVVLTGVARADEAAPWIGARVETAAGGVRVLAVVADAPAERAGLEQGDLVVGVGGDAAPAGSSDLLIDHIRRGRVGDTAILNVRRGGKQLELTLVLEARPDPADRLAKALVGKRLAVGDVPILAGSAPAPKNGEIVLVEFWGTYCRACRSLMPALAKLDAQRARLGVHVLAVSAEQAPRVRRFLGKRPLPYAVGSDAEGKLSRALEIEYVPTFLAVQDGTVRAVHIGAGGAPGFLAAAAKLVKRNK